MSDVMTVAARALVSPATVTVMEVASAMTCALVRIVPSLLTTMPQPAPVPCCVNGPCRSVISVSIDTTDGSTRASTPATFIVSPLSARLAAWAFTAGALLADVVSLVNQPPSAPAPSDSATTVAPAATRPRRDRRGRSSAGGRTSRGDDVDAPGGQVSESSRSSFGGSYRDPAYERSYGGSYFGSYGGSCGGSFGGSRGGSMSTTVRPDGASGLRTGSELSVSQPRNGVAPPAP